MEVLYIKSNDIKALTNAFKTCEEEAGVKSLLIFMADTNHYDTTQLEPLLKASSKNILGGIFPEIIHNGKRKKEGLIIIRSAEKLQSSVFSLDHTSEQVTNILLEKYGEMSEVDGTLFVFVDALGFNKNAFLDSIFNFFGSHINYLGAGAGSLNFHSFPNIISNNGIFENSGLICLHPKKVTIGVAHGWKSISDPLKITKVDGKKIISINWQPAFEVYKKVVEEHSNLKLKKSSFIDLAKSYPIGIAIIDSEMLIRDPYGIEGDSLLLLDGIEEGVYVNIMNGSVESLLNGAKKAREKAVPEKSTKNNIFCVDCISRVLYLNEDFDKELAIIQQDEKLNGILSLGEIANIGESFLECYNKTVVVAKW